MMGYRTTGLVFFYLFLAGSLRLAAQPGRLNFQSSDTELVAAFQWARKTALSYRGDPRDPVGPWYEAALPSRSAFCIRDVSHQCIAAEMLGLSAENRNMLNRFVTNITAEKNWCSYWEINRWNQPAPADYRNDHEFWYNLNANFELIYAALRLFRWTGDSSYILDPAFRYFFDRTLTDYIRDWTLQPDSLLTRPALPHAPAGFDTNNYYITSRGLPSYVESVPGLRMTADLVAAIYQGFISLASIEKIGGHHERARQLIDSADLYRQQMEKNWKAGEGRYHAYYTEPGRFGDGEGALFLLWYNCLANPADQLAVAHTLAKGKWNIETTSYLPVLLFQQGLAAEADRLLRYLAHPATERRSYPEVSFAVVDGLLRGMMGIEPDAASGIVATGFRGTRAITAAVDSLPVLQTKLGILHTGFRLTRFSNQGQTTVRWEPRFYGRHRKIQVNGRNYEARVQTDVQGRIYSTLPAPLSIAPGQQRTARIAG